nr:uncharacterized protein [Mucilaginibacter sp. FT3.2]
MYNFEDKSYMQQPKFMNYDTVKATIAKVKDHCLRNNLQKFYFVFHGGEPLLIDRKFYFDFVALANEQLGGLVKIFYSLQTNGVLLSNEWCSLFKKLNIRVGISLDGPQYIHDKHRIDHAGKGSYNDVIKGITTLKNNGLAAISSLLCVINIESNPEEIYEFFKSHGIKKVDFLYPDLNYDCLPEGLKNEDDATPYADWLIKVFDLWLRDERNATSPSIRRFLNAAMLILGQHTMADDMGLEENNVLVIETDGGIEAVDSLKICGDRFTKANMNINTNTIDQALDSPLALLYYKSHKDLCATCQQCDVKDVCGGGHIVHRYSKKNGFDNPSIYCQDLKKFYNHIKNSLSNILADV